MRHVAGGRHDRHMGIRYGTDGTYRLLLRLALEAYLRFHANVYGILSHSSCQCWPIQWMADGGYLDDYWPHPPFLIITGYTSPIVGAVLAFSLSVHYANFPVCLSVACVFWVFVRSSRKPILTIFLCFLSGIALVVATNRLVGQFRFASKGTYSSIAGRMLVDIPEVLRNKCEEEPDFKLCALESEIFTMSRVETSSLMWYLRGHDKIDREEFDEVLAKELVMYSLLHFPLENTVMAMKNTFSLMSYFPAADGFGPEPDLQKYMPNALAFQKSWQTTRRLYDSLKNLEVPFTILYWTALFICLSAVILGRKNLRATCHYNWPC